MRAVSGKHLARLAEKRGWWLARVSGSHHIYCKGGRFERLTIPIHGNRTLKTGVQRTLMKIIPLQDTEL